MLRISPEEVAEAYAKSGVLPIQGAFFDMDETDNVCGCAISALWCANVGNIDDLGGGYEERWANQTYDIWYLSGFIDGWDDGNGDFVSHNTQEEETNLKLGQEDGRKAWKYIQDSKDNNP